jgi:hypothetical protein
VLKIVRRANLKREVVPFEMRSIDQAQRVVGNQVWEASQLAIKVIKCRLASEQFSRIQSQALVVQGISRDDRLALVDEVNQARIAAIESIRAHLTDEGLGRRFVIPASQWDGTHDGLCIIGIAAVRATLELSPLVVFDKASPRCKDSLEYTASVPA